MKEPYLLQNKTGWHYRRSVPEDLRDVLKKREVKVKLGELDLEPHEAVRLCKAVARETQREFTLARGRVNRKVPVEDEKEIGNEARRMAVELRIEDMKRDDPYFDLSGLTLDHIVEDAQKAYIKDQVAKGRSRKDAAWEANEAENRAHLLEPYMPVYERKLVGELLGGGRPQPDDLRLSAAYARAIKPLPVADEKVRKAAIDQFIEFMGDMLIDQIRRSDVEFFIEKLREDREQGNSTIRRRLGSLSSVAQHGYNNLEIDKRNPFRGHKLPIDDDKNKPQPFNVAHLNLIKAELEGNPRLHWETKATLQLLMNTGARPSEIGAIWREDIILDHAVPHIWLRRHEGRSLKTSASVRHIPLVGAALEGAELAVKNGAEAGPIFITAARTTNSLSAKLVKAIRRAGVPVSRRLVPYSFRHTVKEALVLAKVEATTRRRITGHEGKDVESTYGASVGELTELKVAVVSALEFLGHVDDSVYLPGELV